MSANEDNTNSDSGIRAVRLGQPGGATAVYVVVNAKNSFGGYTGDSLVVVAFKGGSITDVFSLRSQ